ncbi:BofC C-terminal domain-containing protein [Paenibacillus sp. CC-CFT747]|nr:BofC C-terminal domain-containing protein [Paenibacillus sp. CC-CFT747]
MGYSNLLKQLRKKLRLRKRWLSLGAWILAAGVFAAGVAWVGSREEGPEPDAPVMKTVAASKRPAGDDPLQKVKESAKDRAVLLERIYLCGEETEDSGVWKPEAVLQYGKEHPAQEVSLDSEGRVHFTERVDDLSSRCKDRAYFGLDKNGNLSLFEGVPENDKVIRTFFQLNLQYLKSSLPIETWEQLHAGIRVSDVEEYNSVISTFSNFAVTDHPEGKAPNA